MSSSTGDVAVLAVNAVLSIINLAVAAYANRCLLSRDDKRRLRNMRNARRSYAERSDTLGSQGSQTTGAADEPHGLHPSSYMVRPRYYESSDSPSSSNSNVSVDDNGLLLPHDDDAISFTEEDSLYDVKRSNIGAKVRPVGTGGERGRASSHSVTSAYHTNNPSRSQSVSSSASAEPPISINNANEQDWFALQGGRDHRGSGSGTPSLGREADRRRTMNYPELPPSITVPGAFSSNTIGDGGAAGGAVNKSSGGAGSAAATEIYADSSPRGSAKWTTGSIPGQDTGCHWGLFKDKQSLLFMLAIVSSCCQAINLIAMSLLDPAHMEVHGDRIFQDVMTCPQAFSIFLYFTVLCNFLYKLVDAEGRVSAREFHLKLWGSIGLMTCMFAAAVALTATHILPTALELFGCIYQGLLCIAFVVSGWLLPRRILALGDVLSPVATKVRRVCFVTALCLLARLIILIPAVQSLFSFLGAFALSTFYVFGIIPIALSLRVLRSR